MTTTTTISAGSSQTFTAFSDGAVFTVIADGGDVGFVTDENGRDIAFQSGMRRAFGPLLTGRKISVYVQIGSVSVVSDTDSGSSGNGPVVRPASASEADVRAAVAALVTASNGVGTVDLSGLKITLTQGPLPIYPGIGYVGEWGKWTAPGVLDGNDIVDTGGTEIICSPVGAFNCFEWNATDVASPPDYATQSIPAWLQSGVSNVRLEGLTLTGFRNGLKFGAFCNAGIFQSHLKKLHIRSSTEWGVYIANFQNVTGSDWMLIDNALGGAAVVCDNGNYSVAGAWQPRLNCGNSRFTNVFIAKRNKALSRGFWVVSKPNSPAINDISVDKLQVNGGSYTVTGTASFTNGSPNITFAGMTTQQFADAFEVGAHVSFDTAAAGFFANTTYIVRTVNSGTKTITVALGYTNQLPSNTLPNTNPVIYPVINANATATATCRSAGYPLLEVTGWNSTVQPCYLSNFDLENGAASGVYVEEAEVSITDIGLIPGRGVDNINSVTARSALMLLSSAHSLMVDFDINSTVNGSYPIMNGSQQVGSAYGNRGFGVHPLIGTVGAFGTGLDGGSSLIQMKKNGDYSLAISDRNALRLNESIAFLHRAFGFDNQNQNAGGNNYAITFTGSYTTFNLTAIVPDTSGAGKSNGDVGAKFELFNATAGNVTVNCDASQTIRGGGASNTSRTLTPNTGATVIARQEFGSASACFWEWK